MTKNPVDGALTKLDSLMIDIDSARHAIFYLVEVGDGTGARSVLECIGNTLDQVAEDARGCLDIVSKGLKAKKPAAAPS